ncbi:MAG: GTP-binding protein [Candidatus Thorarchaeota archaeon]|nr:GTP-binding protein [Candidatus Thorarchaeota archaeon]
MPVPVYKVLLVGDANVGKSSLIRRVLLDEFDPNYKATVGVDLSAAALNIDPFTPVILTLIDLGGQADFRELRTQYYKGAHAVIFVYDVSDRSTFDSLERWIYGVQENITTREGRELIPLLIANKIDQSETREVSPDEGHSFAERWDFRYGEASAKDGTNVHSLFLDLAKSIYDAYPPVDIRSSTHDK